MLIQPQYHEKIGILYETSRLLHKMSVGVLATTSQALLIVLDVAVRYRTKWSSTSRIRTLVLPGILIVEVVQLLLNGCSDASFYKEIYTYGQSGNNICCRGTRNRSSPNCTRLFEVIPLLTT